MYNKEFELAKKIVKLAYKKNIKNRIFNVEIKSDRTPVTDCDINTENYLIENITKNFPNDNFLTEENNSGNKLQDRTWVIDPIDGTSNFCNNSVLWGIQLAFVDKGEIQFSIMYFPLMKKFFSCLKGNGVYLNNKKLSINTNKRIGKSLAYFVGEFDNLEDKNVELLEHVKNNITALRYLGSSSVTYSLMCLGVCSLLVSYNANHPWDELPGHLMCLELGIKFVDCGMYKGRPLKIYTNIDEIAEYFKKIN